MTLDLDALEAKLNDVSTLGAMLIRGGVHDDVMLDIRPLITATRQRDEALTTMREAIECIKHGSEHQGRAKLERFLARFEPRQTVEKPVCTTCNDAQCLSRADSRLPCFTPIDESQTKPSTEEP